MFFAVALILLGLWPVFFVPFIMPGMYRYKHKCKFCYEELAVCE